MSNEAIMTVDPQQEVAYLRQRVEALERDAAVGRALMRSFPGGSILLFDHDLRCLDTHGLSLERVQVERDLLLGRTMWEVLPPELSASFEQPAYAALQGEYSTLQAPVWERIYEVHFMPVSDEQQRIVAGLVLSYDVTERVEAEQALREREERWLLALRGSDEGVWDWNYTTGEVYFSDRWQEMLGFTPGEVEGHVRSWETLVCPDDMPTVMETLQAHLEGKTDFYRCEHRCRTKDGQWKWILDRGKVIERDAQGQPVRVVGTHTDITDRKNMEAALQENEERFRMAAESSLDDFMILRSERDETGQIIDFSFVYLNERAAQSLAVRRDELHGQHICKLFPINREAGFFDQYVQVVETQTPLEQEFEIPISAHASGWYRHQVIPMADGVAISMENITERKQMEEALSKSQHLLQSLIDHMPAVVFVKDVQGQYLLANRHYAHLMRLEHGQILGRTNEEIVTYHQQHGVISSEEEALILRQLIASRREEDWAILVDKKIIDTEETSVLLGEERICRTIKFPIYDEQGTITAIGGISVDISERKHMETALRESEEKYRVLAENIQDVVWTLDVTGQFTYVSPSVLHLRGYTPEEVMCQSLEEVLTPPSLHVVHDQMHKAPTQAVRLELEQPCKDGSTVWTECITVPLFDEADQLTGWVGVSRDIGERKQMEEALRESEDRYRSLVENINDVIFTLDMKGTITYISPIIRQLSGFEAQEVIGRPFMQFVAPDDLEALQASFQQTIMGHSHPAEFRIITKSRGLVYVRTHSRLMNQGEHVVGVTGVLTDISRWKQAESALQRANEDLKHWIREQQQRMQEITTLTEMSDLFQTCRTQEEAARVIGQLAPQLFAEMSGALYIISASRTHAEAMVSWGDIPMAQVCAPDECWALRRGHAHLAADTSIGLVCQHVPDPPPASTLCVPMMAQGETIGFFHLCRETGGFPDTARQLAVTVAEHVSLAVTNIRLRETLRYQAIRDPLTGLYNRRYMEESLERELRRAARHGMPLGVIMLDLDHFKRFNDTFGHAAGDTVLRELGLMLMSLLRGEDIACRYGGEEFMLIILDTERQAVVQRAELIRQSVSQMVIDHRGQSLGTLSLSLGVALFPQSGMSVDALVRSADRALYEAKSRGRNRVVVDKASL